MATTESAPHSADLVRTSLVLADARRRTRETSRQLWRVAPLVAAVSFCAAAASRWAGWSAILPLSILGVEGAGLVAFVYTSRRGRAITDTTAAEIDAEAGFGGELRSASWFATRETRDAWADFHLERAAERLRATDWMRLYPATRAPRALLATSVMVIGTLAVAIVFPGRAGARAKSLCEGVSGRRDARSGAFPDVPASTRVAEATRRSPGRG